MALAIAAIAPERVAGLGLFHTQARADSPEIKAKRLAQSTAAISDGLVGVVAAQSRLLLAPQSLPSDVSAALSNLDEPGVPRPFRDFAVDALATGAEAFGVQQAAIASRLDERDRIRLLRVPLCVVTGEFDGVTPPAIARELYSLGLTCPWRSLTIIPNCGHLSPFEDPVALTNAMTTWLAAVDAFTQSSSTAT